MHNVKLSPKHKSDHLSIIVRIARHVASDQQEVDRFSHLRSRDWLASYFATDVSLLWAYLQNGTFHAINDYFRPSIHVWTAYAPYRVIDMDSANPVNDRF